MVSVRFNQRGAVNVLLIPLIVLVVLFFTSLGVGYWAFSQRTHYKDDSDQIVATAVQKAINNTESSDAAKYDEEEKTPYNVYVGPAAFGNITISYPKTWSGYVVENDSSSTPIEGYFQPGVVPDITNINNTFALSVELTQTPYDSIMSQFNAQLQAGQVTIAPYTLPKVPSVVGSRVVGQILPNSQGTMIVLPLRNMTLEVWTESNAFTSDFNTDILPHLSFSP
jgi:hypothetical protein